LRTGVLRHADTAMYTAKASGTGYVPFDYSLGHISPHPPAPVGLAMTERDNPSTSLSYRAAVA
jgi:hypothetical protein